MKYNYHIIVIGAGSGGLVVASGAAALGAKVALIEGHKMGGDCLNTGCVPSKSFLKGAHLIHHLKNSDLYGFDVSLNAFNFEKFMVRIQNVIAEIEPHDSVERYESLGVEVKKGYGKFIDAHTISVNDEIITAKNIVIATGSEAFVPPIKGLSNVDYYTNENIFTIKEQPKHLIVLGAGPIGLELGQGFKHIGSEVTLIDQSATLFSKDDPEVAPLMLDVLQTEKIQLKLSSKIIEVHKNDSEIIVTIEKNGKIETVVGDALLVALGRKPNTKHLDLEKAAIYVNERGYIVTNPKLQTNHKHIFACGDITGPYQFTHMAGYQAGIVIRNAIFHLGAKVNYAAVPWTTYTQPEVAHVGQTEMTAKTNQVYHQHFLVPLAEMDRAKTDEDRIGFLKVIVNKKNQLIGATLVGTKAGEQIPLATMAIQKKMKLSVFLNLIFSYPTEAEIFKFSALKALKDGFKPWQQTLVKKIFLR